MLETYVLQPGSPDGGVSVPKPEVRTLESSDTYGKIAVEPLQRGYGITVGNPLRRILLSSIKGSAITWVKIDGVVHEYAVIPSVKEEVMELLLNFKRIRVHSKSDRAGKMRLEVSGEGQVCAGDVATSDDFQIVNPELHLATLDSDQAALSVEFNIERGVGYQVAVKGDGGAGLPVGVLPVDAIFNPVRKVSYGIERTRVGHMTDYERLVLEIWTDGTITPREAVQEAAEGLVTHFFLLTNLSSEEGTGVERAALAVPPEVYQTPIEKLGLSSRTLNCLKRAHIGKVGEVLEMSSNELLKIRNFGEKSLDELHQKLAVYGVIGEKPAPLAAGTAADSSDGPESDVEEGLAEEMEELMRPTVIGKSFEALSQAGLDEAEELPQGDEEESE